MFKSPYGIWSIWPDLSILYRAFFVGLCAVAIYAISAPMTLIVRLRAGLRTSAKQVPTAKDVLACLRAKAETLRQMITAAFYLFGFLLFLGLQGAYNTLSLSRQPPVWEIVANFIGHFAFAANVFFVFLLLHLFQWGLSLWVDRHYSQVDV